MMIKQRTAIPGGVCEFDLPAYHYWLNADADARQNDLQGVARAVAAGARRAGDRPAAAARQRAHQPADRVPRRVPADADVVARSRSCCGWPSTRDLPCVPEISANKYALNIRFLGLSGMDRGAVFDRDVEFELSFCNL